MPYGELLSLGEAERPLMELAKLKKCAMCGEEKKLNEFARKGKLKNGKVKYGYCRVCDNERKKSVPTVDEKEQQDEEISLFDTTSWDEEIVEEEEELDSSKNKLPEEYVESKDFKVWEKYKGSLLSPAERVAIESDFKELILTALDILEVEKRTTIRKENCNETN